MTYEEWLKSLEVSSQNTSSYAGYLPEGFQQWFENTFAGGSIPDTKTVITLFLEELIRDLDAYFSEKIMALDILSSYLPLNTLATDRTISVEVRSMALLYTKIESHILDMLISDTNEPYKIRWAALFATPHNAPIRSKISLDASAPLDLRLEAVSGLFGTITLLELLLDPATPFRLKLGAISGVNTRSPSLTRLLIEQTLPVDLLTRVMISFASRL